MKKLLLLPMLLALAICCFGDTTYNNYTGYNPYWHPLGYPNTATYGETFMAPTNGDNVLQNFSFWMAGPYQSGNIILGAYIATWTGNHAGTLLYSSNSVNYDNTGEAQLSFSVPGGLALTPGANYVMFLSVSQYYGQSQGLSYIDAGSATIPGGGFVYNNNGGDFNSLFSSSWSGPLTPDWAVTLDFNSGGGGGVPEPASLFLLGSGLLGAVGTIRRKLKK